MAPGDLIGSDIDKADAATVGKGNVQQIMSVEQRNRERDDQWYTTERELNSLRQQVNRTHDLIEDVDRRMQRMEIAFQIKGDGNKASSSDRAFMALVILATLITLALNIYLQAGQAGR